MSPKIGYFELPVIDPDRAVSFFDSVFGWKAIPRTWSGGIHILLEGAAGDVGCALAPAGAAGIDTPTPVVHVENSELEDYLEKVEHAGGSVIEQARPVDDLGRFARFQDSEGNVWGLWAPAAPAQS